LWVVAAILSLAVKGLGLNEIVDELKEEASRRNEAIKISRQTVSNIIKRCVNAFLKFEEATKPRFTFSEWQIDDTPQRPTRDLGDHCKQHQNDDKFWFWITNVLDSDSRYLLATYVSFLNRDAEVSEKAILMAIKRAHCTPHIWRCDGLKAHIRGIKNVLPHATIFSKTKAEKPEHINLIENLHYVLRKCIKKRKKFRSMTTLQTIADLFRIWYNFLHRLDSLGGITPAAKVGIAPVFRSWGEFVQYVFRRV
jgi:transposase InsO family protein